jgi:hypothetical protein
MTTPTDAIRVSYHGTYDPGQPESHLQVELYGAKRWYEDGWVYRLEGEVVVATEHDLQPSLYYYDDILVYIVQGKIYCASEPTFMDTRDKHEYTWADLEYVINNYELSDDEDADPITEEECMYVFQNFEDEESYWDPDDDSDDLSDSDD